MQNIGMCIENIIDLCKLLELSIAHAAMANIFYELFTPTLNGIAVSDQYASSVIVILPPGLKDQPQHCE